ncbi:MAG TPA: 5'-nucleotidase C-terminal domain-containing protein, partial [Bacteroidota bacterium]
LRFTYDSRKPRGERLVSVEVQGKRLESSSRYTVATNNYVVSSLQAHFGINQKTMTLTSLPKLDRDIFIDAIRKAKIIDTRTDGRIKDLAEK